MMYYSRRRGVSSVPPPFWNSSCFNDNVWNKVEPFHMGELLPLIPLLFLTFSVIFGNLFWLFMLRKHKGGIRNPLYFLLILQALNGIHIGICVLLASTLAKILSCWPYGELFCMIQAVIHMTLSQYQMFLFIAIAIDRFQCLTRLSHYVRGNLTLPISLGIIMAYLICPILNIVVVFIKHRYFFSKDDIKICKPFWGDNVLKLGSACLYFFVPTLSLMYFYGSLFHMRKQKAINLEIDVHPRSVMMPHGLPAIPQNLFSYPLEAVILAEKRRQYNLARTCAAMALAFVVFVSPWTIQEVIHRSTGFNLPKPVSYILLLLSYTSSLWNPILFFGFESDHRDCAMKFLEKFSCQRPRVSRCCSSDLHYSDDKDNEPTENCSSSLSKLIYPLRTRSEEFEIASDDFLDQEETWSRILDNISVQTE